MVSQMNQQVPHNHWDNEPWLELAAVTQPQFCISSIIMILQFEKQNLQFETFTFYV